MKETILAAAKKTFPEPDYIVNLYDMTPEWASGKLLKILEYNDISEIKSIADLLALENDEQKRAAISEAIGLVGTKVSEAPFRSRTGRIFLMKFRLTRIDIDGEPYEVGKLLECKEAGKK